METLQVDAPQDATPPQGAQASYVHMQPGDIFPWLRQEVTSKPLFALDALAGRYQLYCFFLSAQDADGRAAVTAAMQRRDLFDDRRCSFVGVCMNPVDRREGLGDQLPGIRIAWDHDLTLAKACGAAAVDAAPGDGKPFRRLWVLVDPSLHVLRVFPFSDSPQSILEAVEALPPPDLFGGLQRPAPILVLPNVIEPALCRELIDLYDQNGGVASGVHRNGVGVMQQSFKSRKDFTIADPALLARLRHRISKRVIPEIEKLFFARMTYIERYIVGCYAAEDGGHFGPHRDNGPGLTAHRRFAVSINLNADFGGGEVVFPEYNMQGYKVAAGWAVIFPCAILHQVRPVTSGARYAFLPFLYDAGGQAIREVELARAAAEASDASA